MVTDVVGVKVGVLDWVYVAEYVALEVTVAEKVGDEVYVAENEGVTALSYTRANNKRKGDERRVYHRM